MAYSTSEKKGFAARMRKYPTPTEKMLWERLRGTRLMGWRFQRQAVLCGYIVDFYCPALKLAIEVDGPYHKGQLDRDLSRDLRLAAEGVLVVRIASVRIYKAIEHAVAGLKLLCFFVGTHLLAVDQDAKQEAADAAHFAQSIALELRQDPEAA